MTDSQHPITDEEIDRIATFVSRCTSTGPVGDSLLFIEFLKQVRMRPMPTTSEDKTDGS